MNLQLRPIPRTGLAILFLLGAFATASLAQEPFSVSITLQENGTGTLTNTTGFFAQLTGVLVADPGPSGLPSALTFDLLNPPGLTSGDVFLLDPSNTTSDVIRFNGAAGTVVFYSLLGGDLADTGFPNAFYTNVAQLTENHAGGTLYTPAEGQPGFVTGSGGTVHYSFLSPEGVPDAGSTILLFSWGLVGVVSLRRRVLRSRGRMQAELA